jgi:ubiquinone/menaquinone biosynthesis C-methylase UbiE
MNDYSAKSRYSGSTAQNYDAARERSPRYLRESGIAANIATVIEPDSVILDAPVGTGRLLDLLVDAGHSVVGIDISEDMLAVAAQRESVRTGAATLQSGDLEKLGLEDNSVDYTFCVRFLNWVPPLVMGNIIQEFARVSSKGVVIQVRFTRAITGRELLVGAAKKAKRRIFRFGPWKMMLRRILKPGSRQSTTGQDYIVHERQEVISTLALAGLEVTGEWFVDKRYSLRKRLTYPQYFFLATRSSKSGKVIK